jgi:hypothetical protein
MDAVGGSDGMDFADGKFSINNGLLLRYLNYNLALPSKFRRDSEQEDLDAIEANPISRWIFKNLNLILCAVGVLIGIALFG